MRYLDRFVGRFAPPPATHALSESELDIARAVARGLSNHEIATALYISLSTVKTHLTSV